MFSLQLHDDDQLLSRGNSSVGRAPTGTARPDTGAFPLGLRFNLLNAPGVEQVAPLTTPVPSAPSTPPSRSAIGSRQKREPTQQATREAARTWDREAYRAWDGFDIYCNTFRIRRTSILTLVMFVLALSCIGGAATISLAFYRVADAIIEAERVVDPAVTAAVPLFTHASAVMAQAHESSATVGTLLQHSVTAADEIAVAVSRATSAINATSTLMERAAELARHPTMTLSVN